VILAALRVFVALYLTAGLGSVLRHGTWRDGIAAVLEGASPSASPVRLGIACVIAFVVGLVGDVALWPVNEWNLRRK